MWLIPTARAMPLRLVDSVFHPARSASVCSTFSWMGGESRRSRRKPDSCTTSTRTRLVVVIVALRGLGHERHLAEGAVAERVQLAPLGADLDLALDEDEELVPLPALPRSGSSRRES